MFKPFRFQDLPVELRIKIYTCAWAGKPHCGITQRPEDYLETGLLFVDRRTRLEALPIFVDCVIFDIAAVDMRQHSDPNLRTALPPALRHTWYIEHIKLVAGSRDMLKAFAVKTGGGVEDGEAEDGGVEGMPKSGAGLGKVTPNLAGYFRSLERIWVNEVVFDCELLEVLNLPPNRVNDDDGNVEWLEESEVMDAMRHFQNQIHDLLREAYRASRTREAQVNVNVKLVENFRGSTLLSFSVDIPSKMDRNDHTLSPRILESFKGYEAWRSGLQEAFNTFRSDSE